MKIRATKYLLGLIAGLFIFTACEDDFSEEDLLNLQADLAETKAANDHTRQLAVLAQQLADALALSTADAAEAAAAAAAAAQAQLDLQDYYQTLEANDRAEAEAILAAAGLIGSYTITVTSNESVVADAIVAIRGGANAQDTTDANGQVVFLDVLVGQSYVDVSSTGHMGISYTVDFGEAESNLANIQIGNSNVEIAENDLGSTAVQLIANSASSASHTFRGTVYAQTSLIEDVDGTNPNEMLADIPVKAVLQSDNDSYVGTSATQNVYSTYYVYSTDGNKGIIRDVSFYGDAIRTTDSTDASGNYEIMVPVFEESALTWQIQFPAMVTGTQYVAGVVSDSVEVFGINTTWGLGYGGDAAESVQGYVFSSNDPATQGTGFTLGTWTQVGRSLTQLATEANWESIFDSPTDEQRVAVDQVDEDIVVSHNRQGSGHTATPTVVVGGNGTGDTDASIVAEGTWDFGDIALSASDAGRYTAGATFTLYLDVIGYEQASSTDVDTMRFTIDNALAADGTGLLAAATYDMTSFTLTPSLSDDAGGFASVGFGDNLGSYDMESFHDFNITSTTATLELTGGTDNNTGAASTATVSGVGTTAMHWEIDNGGAGYVGTPTFTFTGSTDDIEVLVFPTRYSFVLDNSGASGYSVLPSVISFSGDQYTGDVNTTQEMSSESVFGYDGTSFINSGDLADLLQIDGDTIISWNSTVDNFHTNSYFASTPSMDDVEDDFANADLNLTFTNGEITAASASSTGNGYDAQITFSVTGRPVRATALTGFTTTPTTAAAITTNFSNFTRDARTNEFVWNSAVVNLDEGGEDYRVEINDTTTPTAVSTVNFGSYTSSDGGTTVINMNYGFGERDTTPEGDN